MKRTLALAALVALGCMLSGCPGARPTPPPTVINPRFDPAASPPVVPTPTDLATDPRTGLLSIPPNPAYTELDRAFIAYLQTLDGFPASTPAVATFSGALDASTVSARTVQVLDLGTAPIEQADPGGFQPLADVQLTYVDQPGDPANPGQLTLAPPGGLWQAGHSYAVALLGGDAGLKGAHGEPVVGTPTWALMRSSQPLVTCQDLASPGCLSKTDILPVDAGIPLDDVAGRIADQTQTAIRIEGIRRHYAPALDSLSARGTPRANVALLWTFKITDQPMVVFSPSAVPPRVPLPTNLALDPTTGLLNAPIDPNASPAEQQFTREYLNTLHGFPQATPGSAGISGGDLDPATVTPDSVRFFDLTSGEDGGTASPPALAYDPVKKQLTLTPPGGLWPKGGTFEVAVIAGPAGGLRMTDGRTPLGSEVWSLLRGTLPIASCLDAANPACRSNLTLAPIKPADAIKLETIRLQYKPLLDQLEAQGIPRASVAVLWTFTIAPNPEAYFDPANQIVPFPNDIIRTPPDGGAPAHVNVPVPDGGSPAAVQLVNQVNSLDGFSTTAMSVSETSFTRGVLDVGLLNAGALDAGAFDGGIGFFKLSDGGTAPRVTICLNCASTPLPDGGPPAEPQQLQFVPQVPLDEQATYAAYLTTDVTDTTGLPIIADPAFALLRSSTPLVKPDGGTLVSLITDQQAQQLEPVRQTLKPVLDALEARGLPRSRVALAWGFTTQSTRPTLQQLYALPQQLGAALPATIVDLANRNDVYKSTFNPFPYNNLGTVYVGHLSIADVLTGPGGVADPSNPKIKVVPFVLTTPSSAAPASGYPVAIWGHPITASEISVLGIADAFAAAGLAMISIDLPWHGARTTCIGAKDAVTLPGATSDDAACQSPATCNETTGQCASSSPGSTCVPGAAGDLLCQNNNEGFCIGSGAVGSCEGPTFKMDSTTHAPVVSGWNFISSNFFATRDSFRQHVVDVAQLERVLQATGPGSLNAALGASALDKGRIHYVGMSLGGMVGVLSASVSPNLHRVALNAAGADLPSILLNGLTPAARAQFLAQAAANGLTPGTLAFDQFLGILQWAMDPGDPANHALAMMSGPAAPADRRVLVQYILNDPVIPNANTQRIISAANVSPRGPVTVLQNDSATLTGTDRHAYLISTKDTATMTQAQQQIVNFITAP